MSDVFRRRFLLVMVYLAFMSLGLPDGSFGVSWPLMHRDIGAPIEMAGLVMTVGTLLTALAGFSSGWVLARLNENTVLVISCALTGIGLAGMAAVHRPWMLFLAVMPLGLGAGAVDAGLNGYVAKHYSSRHMNWLHACWGVGATSGPLILSQVLAWGGTWRHAFAAIAVAQFLMAVMFVVTRRVWLAAPEVHESASAGGARARGAPRLRAQSLAGWLSPVVFYFYVGVEFTIGLWSSSLLTVSRGIPAVSAAAAVGGFFAAITVGRIVVGLVAQRVGNSRLVAGGGLVALVGILGIAVASSVEAAAVALVVTGLGLSPVYPGLMHEVGNRFEPSAVQTVIGRQSGGASLGAATMPAVAGVLAARSLEWVPWFALTLCLLLLASNGILERLARRENT